jgi:uncharacterized protein YigE (DUF2233 family)
MRFFFFLLSVLGSGLGAAEIEKISFEKKSYLLCRVDSRQDDLRLFLKDDEGKFIHSFTRLQQLLTSRRQTLVWAMNAGLFHPDYAPVGLYVENGRELFPLNQRSGDGNFFLKPNGVFFIKRKTIGVLESSRFASRSRLPDWATQSGPLLVHQGALHPAFQKNSLSVHLRNGVGIVSPTQAVFALSEEPVNFHEFARLFRDHLHCQEALYLDGTISSVYSPSQQRLGQVVPFGPLLAVVQSQEPARKK